MYSSTMSLSCRVVSDRQVLADVEHEVAAALADHDRALHAGRPDERSADDLAQVVEQRVAAVLGGLHHARVDVGAERKTVRPRDAGVAAAPRRHAPLLG